MKIFFTFCLLSIIFLKVAFGQFLNNERNAFNEQKWNDLKLLSREKEILNPDTTIDIKFYHLDIKIAIDSQYISGSVYIELQPAINNLNIVGLNLQASMIVDSVTMDAVSSNAVGNNILINLSGNYNIGDPVKIKIYYHGVPELANGLKGLHYSTHGANEPVIATLSTPFLSHYWWPCKDGPDDKADSVYVDITIKDSTVNGIPLIAVSNGLLDAVDSSSGIWKTFKWKHRYPIVPYYVMAAISNYKPIYQTYTGTNSTFPLTYYVFNEDYSQSVAGVAQIPDALDRFIELYGDYPFKKEKYGMTEIGYYGAIENQTNTIIEQMDTSWYYTSVHEMSHQWFGDMITCENWHHAWLNEGFATYSEALVSEYLHGFNSYKTYMSYLEFYDAGTLYLPQDTDAFNIFQTIVYLKGAYVMHMLRGILGDPVFFDCLHTYATSSQFKYGHATTENFRQVCETISGQNLQYFFDQWIYDERYPIYRYNYYSHPSLHSTALGIYQKQVVNGWRSVFKMPLQIRFLFSTGNDTLITVMNDQQYQTYYFNFTDSVTNITVDPDNWVLKTANYDASVHVSIDENAGNASFTIYPNPAGDFIIVKVSEKLLGTQFTITDLTGRVVLKDKLMSESTNIDISGLSIGMYVLEIGKLNKQTFKVLKK
jgi:aminopeptidase N